MRALYRKSHCRGTGLSAVSGRRHAVVVGGSMAGMLAARVLADHFDAVTLLERDRFPETPAPRKGLPQGRHGHALLERGNAPAARDAMASANAAAQSASGYSYPPFIDHRPFFAWTCLMATAIAPVIIVGPSGLSRPVAVSAPPMVSVSAAAFA